MLTKLAYAAGAYTALGLAGGLLYREVTRGEAWQFTQLNVVHTHLIALGTLMMLIVLVLEKSFALSQRREMTYFWWLYNVGLVVSTTMMTIKGIMQQTAEVDSPAMAGISGLGHIMLTIGLVFLFVALIKQVKAAEKSAGSAEIVEPAGS